MMSKKDNMVWLPCDWQVAMTANVIPDRGLEIHKHDRSTLSSNYGHLRLKKILGCKTAGKLMTTD